MLNNVLHKYLQSLYIQNDLLKQINQALTKQQELIQKEKWNELNQLLKEINDYIELREQLGKQSEEIKEKIVKLLGIEKFDKQVVDKIPNSSLFGILTEINNLRFNLEKGKQITYDNVDLLKTKIDGNKDRVDKIHESL
ncbi:hypothetical protein [Desulfitibacter alkalitolerans]|uniref:hypothetical protein n=1 Tax=Desulfitibacter alkalitolerans TaxID=264641 RepID=UPI0012EC9C66|nr:hypothetical protein [Desulfitibacter alkalitolerans]